MDTKGVNSIKFKNKFIEQCKKRGMDSDVAYELYEYFYHCRVSNIIELDDGNLFIIEKMRVTGEWGSFDDYRRNKWKGETYHDNDTVQALHDLGEDKPSVRDKYFFRRYWIVASPYYYCDEGIWYFPYPDTLRLGCIDVGEAEYLAFGDRLGGMPTIEYGKYRINEDPYRLLLIKAFKAEQERREKLKRKCYKNVLGNAWRIKTKKIEGEKWDFIEQKIDEVYL